MTDFYSVLKTSIIRRNLRSPAARHEVYEQAREAMIRRLWSLEPPLSDEEIDARIGLFDDAVEKIEVDLETSFATAENVGRQRAPVRNPRRPPPAQQIRPPPAYEAPDEEVAYDPVAARQAMPPRRQMRQPPAAYGEGRDGMAEDGRRRRARREPSRGSRNGAYDDRGVGTRLREPPDDDWHVAEGYVAESQPQFYAAQPAYRPAARRFQDQRGDARDEPAYGAFEEDIDREAFDRGARNQLPAVVEISAPNGADGEFTYRADRYGQTDFREEAYRQPRYEEAAYYESDDRDVDDPYYAEPAPRGGAYDARRIPDPANDVYEDDFVPPAPRNRRNERRQGKRARGKRENRPRQTRSRSVPILAIAIGTLAVILIGFNAYVFLPILLGSDPVRSTSATTSPKIEDRLPALESSGAASARIVSGSATAVEIPERNLDIAETLVIFNGTDPTVFEGTSNNPIQFDSDTEGGFARISSAASAAGARAVIGPGLAERLAGRTVRVTLLARSSNENGAANMRFAYQSGLAVSHWQTADLSSNYGTYGMIWRVPAADTGARDYLLIEPGIPGDGTSTDIRMIKIDVLSS